MQSTKRRTKTYETNRGNITYETVGGHPTLNSRIVFYGFKYMQNHSRSRFARYQLTSEVIGVNKPEMLVKFRHYLANVVFDVNLFSIDILMFVFSPR